MTTTRSSEMPLLVDEMEDFTRNDPSDTTFEEFDTPTWLGSSLDWRTDRPSILKSAVNAAWVCLQLVFAGGLFMGGIAVFQFYIDINTIHYCHWVAQKNLKRLRVSQRVVGSAFQSFLMEFWQFLTLWIVFGWPMLKKLNLLTITMLVAFGDFSYRLFLHIFDAFKPPWIPYPMNVLFAVLVLYSSYALGREVFSYRKSKALALGFKLCAQFLLTLPVTFFFLDAVFEWFVQERREFHRLLLAAFTPMILLPGKAIARLGASHLQGVNHPGTSFAIVAVAYGACSIVFRTMQAGMESYALFIVLSVGYGVVFAIERLTVQLRDGWWERFCRITRRPNVHSPRRQRLTADMTLQAVLFESAVVVGATGVRLLYGLVYGTSANRFLILRVELVRRSLSALVLEWLFGAIVVFVQTRYLNIPVSRVWRRRWKRHLLVALLTIVMIGLYFTEHLLGFIRNEYEADDKFFLTKNCTKAF